MPKFRAKLVEDSNVPRRLRVNLPEYELVEESFQGPATLTDGDGWFDAELATGAPTDISQVIAQVTVEVDVPDRIWDPDTGRPSKDKIRKLYAGDPRWDRDNVTDDV